MRGQLYMTPRALKKAMERKWKLPGVSEPCRPARWMIEDARLVADHNVDVPDPDDGGPFYP